MKRFAFLISLLISLTLLLAACGATPALEPAPATEVPTKIPTEVPTETPPVDDTIVVEIVGPTETVALTMSDLLALPVTEGYAGTKSSTGKIIPPLPFKGVALKDLVTLVGGMDETIGFNVVAEDGYSITFSYDQIQNGTFVAYDPATGDELKNSVDLTAILAYEADGNPLDAKGDGIVRLAIISDSLNQVTDGHWSVKWVAKLEAPFILAKVLI